MSTPGAAKALRHSGAGAGSAGPLSSPGFHQQRVSPAMMQTCHTGSDCRSRAPPTRRVSGAE